MIITPGRRQSKTSILATNVDKNPLETELSIAIWRQTAIENTVSSDFDPRSSIVKSVFDCRLPGVNMLDAFMQLYCRHGGLRMLYNFKQQIQ